MNQERPNSITILGDYNILSAVLLILSFFPIEKFLGISVILPDFLKIPNISEEIIKGVLAIIIIIIALGYLKLKKWGYWLIISEKLLFILGWIISYLLNNQNPIAPYFLLSMIELIYIVPTFKYFYRKID